MKSQPVGFLLEDPIALFAQFQFLTIDTDRWQRLSIQFGLMTDEGRRTEGILLGVSGRKRFWRLLCKANGEKTWL